MSWRISVRHRTGYRYAGPVLASYNEARLTPPSVDGQHTLTVTTSTNLSISQRVTIRKKGIF